jgi:uncharacterized protein
MTAAPGADVPHLPRSAPIDAYGKGGFRFGNMSHRGSLLCLPDGIWAWSVTAPAELSEATLAPVFARAQSIDIFLIGGGIDPWFLLQLLRSRFHDLHVSVDVMTTGSAVSTYNILLAEGRRVGAGLIAVG